MAIISDGMDRRDRQPDRAPNCLKCRHFQVTWDSRYPRACRVFGIKSRRLPSLVVKENTGQHCPSFEQDPRVR